MRLPEHKGGPGDHQEGHPEGAHQGWKKLYFDLIFIFKTYITSLMNYLFIFLIKFAKNQVKNTYMT